MRKTATTLFLLLAGCAYQSEIITADQSQISIKAGPYANPGEQATTHCKAFNRNAVLVESDRGIYRFECRV